MHKLDSIAAKDFENEFFRWHKRYPNFKNPKNILEQAFWELSNLCQEYFF